MISVPMFNLAQVTDVDKLTKISTKVFSSSQHILGPNVQNFELKFEDYIGVNHCLGVANGSDALVIALRAIGVKKDDEVAKEVFEFTGKILGMSLANFVMFSSPEAIILFGGLTKAGDLILKPTRAHMEANVIEIFENKVKILLSHLKESDAAILGASALMWD